MPKNKKGGNKAKKGSNKRFAEAENQPFVTKDPEGGQEYAKVIKSMGGCPPMLNVNCSDDKERIGVITGRLRKKVFCNKEDIVLVNLRDYQDSKCDIIWKYSDRETKRLVKEGEISSRFAGIRTAGGSDDKYNDFDSIFNFDYKKDEDDKDDKDDKDGDKEEDKDDKKEDKAVKKDESSSSSSEYETDSDEEIDIANI
jgi:translation initiation factor 1A